MTLTSNACVDRILRIVNETRAPLLFEVIKSIAALCNVDPYELWYALAQTSKPTTSISTTTAKPRTGPCWRCPACGKEFDDVRTLVNHILYYVRQRDRAHIEVYRKIKQKVEQTGQTFTAVVMNELKC